MKYAGFESSIVCPPLKGKKYLHCTDDQLAIYREMFRAFESNCNGKVSRFEVTYADLKSAQNGNWLVSDDKLGRTAHVALIEDIQFLDMAVFLNNMHA